MSQRAYHNLRNAEQICATWRRTQRERKEKQMQTFKTSLVIIVVAFFVGLTFYSGQRAGIALWPIPKEEVQTQEHTVTHHWGDVDQTGIAGEITTKKGPKR